MVWLDQNDMKQLADAVEHRASLDLVGLAQHDIDLAAVGPFQTLCTALGRIAAALAPAIVKASRNVLACWLGGDAAIVRAMPNTPALVLEGVTAVARADGLKPGDLEAAQELFAAVGKVVVLEESAMDAVTGLSGSGPAYVAIAIEALADGGVKMGLDRATAMTLAAQTVLGSARLLLETGVHPGQLKDMVSSPGGTTIAQIDGHAAGGGYGAAGQTRGRRPRTAGRSPGVDGGEVP